MKIIKASLTDLPGVATLFDLYRQFYACPPDLNLATEYIKARMENGESQIFVALDNNEARGFVQLYPTFCSIEAIKIFVLYDLFVDVNYRNCGIGAKLMNRATEWARDNDAARLDLLTEKTNYPGQHLYEKLGYKKVLEDCFAYSLKIS